MPKGLLDKLTRDEILDLIAYVIARGDAKSELFQGGHDHAGTSTSATVSLARGRLEQRDAGREAVEEVLAADGADLALGEEAGDGQIRASSCDNVAAS